MITIIKPGRDIFITTCPICDCEFRYESGDVKIINEGIGQKYNEFVICPNCGYKVTIGPTIKHINMAGEPVKC